MKKKYIVLASIVIVVLGLFILNLYNNLERQRQQNKQLTEQYEPKTLTLSPNTIQITSIDNQNPTVVCSNPKGYTYWRGNGRVDFFQISGSFGGLNYRDLMYFVRMGDFEIDGNRGRTDDFSFNNVDIRDNRFSFSFSGISPTESHVLKTSFTLENPYLQITSTPVYVTYSMPKLC